MDNLGDGSTNGSPVYIYMGVEAVPENVTRARVDPSVTSIHSEAFQNCLNLQEVQLSEGLLTVESRAFRNCQSLKKLSIPSTVKDIGSQAFEGCVQLEAVVLPEGLLKLGRRAFLSCRSLQRFNVPPRVQTIESETFCSCSGLMEVVFSEGLREISSAAFANCMSLVSVHLPSSLKVICEMAFGACFELTEMNIPDAIENIKRDAFDGCNFHNFRIPPLVTNVDIMFVGHSSNIVSLELSKHVRRIEDDPNLKSADLNFLRNVAIPQECDLDQTAIFERCRDLRKVFPDVDGTEVAAYLQQRFDALPIHKICYYQSYYPTWTAMSSLKREINPWSSKFLGKLNLTGKQADCLGMTPLHILACSTKHDVEIYRILIEKYPENLIAKDKWGALPILYAFWVNAPSDVFTLLVESHKTLFPNDVLDWGGMVKTLAESNTPLGNIQNLLKTQQRSFPDQYLDMQDVVMKLAESTTYSSMFNRICVRIATFRYLLEVSMFKRLDSLNVKRWREEMETSINKFPDISTLREGNAIRLYSKLVSYETLKEATMLLELVLWKANIGKCMSNGKIRCHKKARVGNEVNRQDCRINCGADIVVRNVLPFL